jgi:hypothetical protein
VYRTDIIKLSDNRGIERGSAEIDNQGGLSGSGLQLRETGERRRQ